MSDTNYCPKCHHPVLLRAPNGMCPDCAKEEQPNLLEQHRLADPGDGHIYCQDCGLNEYYAQTRPCSEEERQIWLDLKELMWGDLQ
jgi:NMD protein affecting ribosome stability and mRNA decay